jgi:polar amino acid transport system substrate-binding protein
VGRDRLIALALAFVLSSLAACSVGGSDEAGSLLPEEELVEPGALTVCTDPTRPPLEYRARDGVVRGFEVDLLTAIAERLDLDVTWVEIERNDVEVALLRGRCDLATSVGVRRDLLGGVLTRFPATAYLSAPLSLLVRNDERPRALTGLCGLRVGVFQATREEHLLRGYSDACRAREQAPIRVVGATGTPVLLEQLAAGRIDAVFAEHPVNDWYARRQTDRYDVAWILGDEVVRWAIGSRPGADAVSGALKGELLGMHDDGSFRELLGLWALDRAGATPLPIT